MEVAQESMLRFGTAILCAGSFFVSLQPAFASGRDARELLSLSLSELSDVMITTASKKSEPENEASAAVFVITNEDIKRSGATNIPDILRMAPGITVTQSSSNNWTVTARGFNDQFSNKLLVLMDGRTVYSPLFSGVVWDSQDTMIEDIERIEIIRGPGATLWGANAVNGIINIITKSSRHIQGGLATANIGNKASIGSVRYSTDIGNDTYARIYAKHSDYNSQYLTGGSDAGDSWRRQQAGFRSDMKIGIGNNIKIQGDIYAVDEDNGYILPDLALSGYNDGSKGFKLGGGNLLLRWENKWNNDSETHFQTYFDNASQKTSFFSDEANTVDFEFQHFWSGWERQELVWGGGYRFINNSSKISTQYELTPKTRNDDIISAFVQDKIALIKNTLFLTLGSKFEHNDYSGLEIQPSVRMSWIIDNTQTLWGAISRAVHTPSRFNSDGRLSYTILPPSIAVPLPVILTGVGNKNLDSEKLTAYELGYRIKPRKNISLDFTAFYNDYSELFTSTLGTAVNMGTYISQPIIAQNMNEAHSVGFETAVKYKVTSDWQLTGTYSYISLKFDDKSQGTQFFIGKHPKHMFNLRSVYLFPNRLEMTNSLYTVSDLHSINIPGYYRFDTKFSYPITEDVNISIAGQNLINSRHREFAPFLYQSQEAIGRSVYAGLAFKF